VSIPVDSNKLALLTKIGARLKELEEAERYENSLIEFASYVWPVVEPAIPFVRGWAIEAVAEHLEAVTYGHIRRLLINVPPGFTKSLMTDVFWPAWEWGPKDMPWLRYICASYSNSLTERDNMRCRNVVVSRRYQKLWKNRFAISGEQFTKIKFANDKTGWKLATSVAGIGVGERGDRFIIDDPNNTMEMESEANRNTTNMWFTEVVPDRLNNQAESAIIVIQQRLHEDDVSGVAISREMGYTHLMIPMEYDSSRHCVTVLGLDENNNEIRWEDPRKEEYELAWPERFPVKVWEDLRRDKGPYAIASQYMQSPEPRGGSIIKRDFWRLWTEDKYPSFEYILASLDTAYTEKQTNDPSAMTIWGLFRDEYGNPRVMLIYAWRDRLQFNDLVQKVIDVCTKDKRELNHLGEPFSHPRFEIDGLLIENKAAGLSAGQEIHRLVGATGKFGIHFFDPKKYGDKVARTHSVQHIWSEGIVWAPDRAFADMVIDEMAVFPHGSHDDLHDTAVMGLRYLRDMGFALRREEHAVDVEQDLLYKPRQSALYPA